MDWWPDIEVEQFPDDVKRVRAQEQKAIILDIINKMDLFYYEGMGEKQKQEYCKWRNDYVNFTVGIPHWMHNFPKG